MRTWGAIQVYVAINLAILPVFASNTDRSPAPALRRRPRLHAPQQRAESTTAYLCGHRWQRDYTVLHSSILSSQAPAKFAVSFGADTGLADRLAGTFSVFYYALLSGRAFQIASYPGVVSLREAFEPVNIDWDRPDMEDGIVANIKSHYAGNRRNIPSSPIPPGLNTSKYWPVYAINNDAMSALLSGNVRQNPGGHANATTVVIASNRGRVWKLFDNPVHKRELLEYGLRPDTAIACAYRFLFQPRQEVRAMYKATWDALSDTSALKIGIQIRVGDCAFNASSKTCPQTNPKATWNGIAPYFACAARIEQARALPGQKVLYYVTSDSLAVRRLAKQRLGDKVVTDTNTPPAHIGCYHGGTCSQDGQVLALRHAAGELISYSMADYHVYSKHSGFGRIGAWLSLSWHHHYMISNENSGCGGMNGYTDLRVDASVRAGV